MSLSRGLQSVLLLILALSLGSVGCPRRVEKPEFPEDVLVADRAVVVDVSPDDLATGLEIPKTFEVLSAKELENLAVYRIGADELEPLSFELDDRHLRGDFVAGDRVLIHWPLTDWTVNKYTLLCRLRWIDAVLFRPVPDFEERLCWRILCPSEVFFADELLDEFPDLEGFRDQFDRDELSEMELGPIGDGLGNICERCFGREPTGVLIPDCREVVPVRHCWVPHGPGPTTQGQVEGIVNGEVVGAINAVTLHPTDPAIAYVGGTNGGIWRTDNLTSTDPSWSRQSDFKESLSIGALEFDPTDTSNNTLWAGFGRASSFNPGGVSVGGARAGLLRTTDGANWTAVDGGGTIVGLNVSGIAPRGDTIVVTANTADSFANRGVWRSPDGGVTWNQLSGDGTSGLPTGLSRDLIGDPSNAARLYAHAGNRIYRSDDTGATWTQVSTAVVNAALGVAGNVELAIGTSNNVYVATVSVGRLSGLFRSGNSGGTWTALDLPQTTENGGNVFGIHPGGQGNLHLSLAADPTNANVVYIGGDRQPCFTEANNCSIFPTPRFPNSINAFGFTGRLFRVDASQATGNQATPLTHVNTAGNSSPHADSREMDVDANGDLIEGDDGGIYRRTTPLTNTGDWFTLNGDIQTTELHDISWDSNADIIIGGAQDTGAPEEMSTGGVTWRSVRQADGGDVAVDDTGSPGVSVRYSSAQNLGNFARQTFDASNVLQSTVFLDNPAIQVTAGSNAVQPQFYTPIEVNNQNPSRLIMGAQNSVYESTNQGTTWNEIGVGIRVNDVGADPIAYGATGNPNMLYVGSGTQVRIRTTAAGALNNSAAYPGTQQVVDLAINVGDPLMAFAVDNGNVFMTDDAGATWTDVTGDLATINDGVIRSLAFATGGRLRTPRPPRIAVGTDVGVFYAEGPAFNEWRRLGCSLPTVPVFDLDYDTTDRVWVAGTLGRGAWTLEDN